MTGSRTALLITTDGHADDRFPALHAPRQDANALADVLADPEIGGYRIDVLHNAPAHEVRLRIDGFFADAEPGDLLLLYVSGHGVRDEAGRLQLATTDTQRNRLVSTAVAAEFIRDCIDHSRARKVVVWLDCCYAGLFPAGRIPKAADTVDVLEQLTTRSGRGCAVMTSSTHYQYSFESGGDRVDDLTDQPLPSVFTGAIVAGLRTGDADLNADGDIDAAELYEYVYDRVKATTPSQTPSRNHQVTGELYLARSKRGLRLPPELPEEIRRNLRSSVHGFRVAAVRELADLAANGDTAQRAVAATTIDRLRVGPDQQLVEILEDTIAGSPAPEPPEAASPVYPPPSTSQAPRPRAPTRKRRLNVELALGLAGLGAAGFGLLFGVMAFIDDARVLPTGSIPGWLNLLITLAVGLFFAGSIEFFVLQLYRHYRDPSVTLIARRPGADMAVFRPDGRTLVSLGAATGLAWDTESWSAEEIPHWQQGRYDRAAFSESGILAVAHGEQVLLWDSNIQWRALTRKVCHDQPISAISFSPNGKLLATGDWGGLIKIWDAADWSLVTSCKVHDDALGALAFSPDGTVLATGDRYTVSFRSTSDWQETSFIYVGDVESLAFSPDGSVLAAQSGYRKDVTLWHVETRRRIESFASRGSGGIAFSTNGELLAFGRKRGGIRLVETATWSVVRTLIGFPNPPVTSLAFSPDSRVLVSTDRYQTLRLWQLS